MCRASPSDLVRDPLAAMPLPDTYKKIQAYDQIRLRPGEVIGYYVVREQRAFRETTEAPRRIRHVREEKDKRRHRHTSPGYSPADSEFDFDMVDEENGRIDPSSRQKTGQTCFEQEIRVYRLISNARLSREARQMVLAGTRHDTEYGPVVTQLRSAWDDWDFRDRDRGGLGFGKSGRTVRFADADREW